MKQIKGILYFLLKILNLSYIVRLLTKKRVTILVYHNPSQKNFLTHIEYLSKYYNFIYLHEYITAYNNKELNKLPLNSVCITIDDGYKENYNLLGIIKKYIVKPTIFLCPGILGTNRHYWDKECTKEDILKLKKYSNLERKYYLKNKYNFEETKIYNSRQSLNINEINEMKEYVDFQLHSNFHADLAMCTKNELETEIFIAKKKLEKILEKKVFHIGYPHGSYNDEVVNFAKSLGFISGRSINCGFNGKKTKLFELKVIGISDDASLNKLNAQLTCIPMYVNYLLKGNLKGNFKK